MLFKQHTVVFLTVFVKPVVFEGNENGLFKVQTVQTAIVDCNFCRCAAVQGIEQLRVFKKHRFFILTACNGVVYVRKFIALGVFVLANLKDAVIKDCLNGDDILHALWHDKSLLVLLKQVFQCLNHCVLLPP